MYGSASDFFSFVFCLFQLNIFILSDKSDLIKKYETPDV